MPSPPEAVETLTYRFRWKDGREKEVSVRLRAPSMRLEPPTRADYPDWTRLEVHQCPNCPLKPADSPRCPAAASLVDLIEMFKDCLSTDVVEVTIMGSNREYRKTFGVYDGVSSLMGVYMAASGCPILDKLRPMLYSHLPFANLDETIYRAVGMYLIAQFLRHKRGENPDWDLAGLERVYSEINTVNRAFIKRLQEINSKDAGLNALVKLDCFASFAVFSLKRDHLRRLEELFAPYLTPPAPAA